MSEYKPRLIDGNALLSKALHTKDIAKQDGELLVVGLGYIHSAPTVEAAPVRRGEWMQFSYFGDLLKCSLCGQITKQDRHEYGYCPNCGAYMRKGGE